MNNKTLENYIAIFQASNLQKLSIKTKDFEVTMESPVTPKDAVELSQSPESARLPNPDAPVKSSQNTIVKAPIVGVFYAAASPGETPFVRVGQKIEAGAQIGIIEAMKVMNEIVAPKSGIVEAIFIQDKANVEYDQPLIEIR